MSKREIFFVTDNNLKITEAFRTLRTNLAFLREEEKGKTLLFTSSIPAEGKSFVASNYAASLSIAKKKVLLVDCDIRRPRAHRSFGIEIKEGLESLLTHDTPVEKLIMKDILPNLDLLPTKNMKHNVTELFLRDKIKNMIVELKDKYDTIILDTPPLAVASDAAILSKAVDGVVVVVGYDQVAKRELEYTKSMLNNAKANIYGFIVNGVDKKGLSYGNYGYYNNNYSYYEEYYSDDEGNRKKRKVKRAPKSKFEAFMNRVKAAYRRHLSGDIKKRR